MIRFTWSIIGHVLKLGIPIALQDLLVGISFLVLQAIVNTLGVTASVSFLFGVAMFSLSFFCGTLLTGIFAKDRILPS